jgi:hypothetical protein
MVNQLHQNRTLKIFCSITILFVPFLSFNTIVYEKEGAQYYLQTASGYEQISYPMDTGF